MNYINFSKMKFFFICLLVCLFICIIGILFFYQIALLENEINRKIASIAYKGYLSPLTSLIVSIPCEEVFKLFPDMEKDGLLRTSPELLDDSNYWVSYLKGSKKSVFPFLTNDFFKNFFLYNISDEPRCFKALATFVEAVNNSTK
tara:strand:- start:277 stop:711 length:435 start_codon:yes stop_codon:yes gene_type:complete